MVRLELPEPTLKEEKSTHLHMIAVEVTIKTVSQLLVSLNEFCRGPCVYHFAQVESIIAHSSGETIVHRPYSIFGRHSRT